jgi:hypothetical protein
MLLAVTVGFFQGSAMPAGTKDQLPQVKPKDQPPAGNKEGEPRIERDEPKDIEIKAKITKDDPLDTVRKDSHCKVHKFKMLAGYAYVIDMKADPHKEKDMPSFDTYLRLEDATGKQLAENDDFITTDSRIIFSPEKSGEFRIVCTTFDAGFTGSYTLTVSPHKGGKADGGGILVFTANGQLTNADPFDTKRPTSKAKLHTVKLLKGKTYQIDMTSMQFNTYLRLEDAKGKQIAEDSNNMGMGGLNSSLSVTPQVTGDYRIVATTLIGNQMGGYVLKVTQR